MTIHRLAGEAKAVSPLGLLLAKGRVVSQPLKSIFQKKSGLKFASFCSSFVLNARAYDG
jgi:hypothetical protein